MFWFLLQNIYIYVDTCKLYVHKIVINFKDYVLKMIKNWVIFSKQNKVKLILKNYAINYSNFVALWNNVNQIFFLPLTIFLIFNEAKFFLIEGKILYLLTNWLNLSNNSNFETYSKEFILYKSVKLDFSFDYSCES